MIEELSIDDYGKMPIGEMEQREFTIRLQKAGAFKQIKRLELGIEERNAEVAALQSQNAGDGMRIKKLELYLEELDFETAKMDIGRYRREHGICTTTPPPGWPGSRKPPKTGEET